MFKVSQKKQPFNQAVYNMRGLSRLGRMTYDAGILGLELLTIGNYRAFLGICPNAIFEAPRSQFREVNETNETRDGMCLILMNKTAKCLITRHLPVFYGLYSS